MEDIVLQTDKISEENNSKKQNRLLKFYRQLFISQMSQLKKGLLTVIDDAAVLYFGDQSNNSKPQVTIHVHNWLFYRAIVLAGSVGAGESYANDLWSCENLTDLMRIFLINRDVLDRLETGWAKLTSPLRKWAHKRNRNTEAGSLRNIAAHYDLGNEFFAVFLDTNMMYSSAIFPHEDAELEQASSNKLDHICKKLQLDGNDHLLEIGTGWGGFAIHAAKYYGCKVTTTTISKQQYLFAKQKIATAGLADQITVLQKDYRDLEGQYDKLVSIEMIEAVGHHYFEKFFAQCSALLKPDGMMLLQAISIQDQQYKKALRSVDFIQEFIFPGSCIPSLTELSKAATQASDLRILHVEDIGFHYALTLQKWCQKFLAHSSKIAALGFNRSFIRLWEFYFCYCEAGFLERALSDFQIIWSKPQCRLPIPIMQFNQ